LHSKRSSCLILAFSAYYEKTTSGAGSRASAKQYGTEQVVGILHTRVEEIELRIYMGIETNTAEAGKARTSASATAKNGRSS